MGGGVVGGIGWGVRGGVRGGLEGGEGVGGEGERGPVTSLYSAYPYVRA